MWVFNVFLWMMMGISSIQEDEYYTLWSWRGAGTPTGPHPDNPVR